MHRPIANRIAQFRRDNGFAAHDESAAIWMATLGPLELPLPNFRWRREILARHDSHHLLTGYDTSARGELLVAAWETGAHCYHDLRARALCGFLMILGLLRYPVATLRAFQRGRGERIQQAIVSRRPIPTLSKQVIRRRRWKV